MDSQSMRRQMVVARGTLGVGAVIAPRALGRMFGVEPADNPVAPYLMRLFGIREIFMAWDLHLAADDDLERTVARSIPVDAADALASSLAGIAGYLPRRAAAMSTATAIVGTVNGIVLRSKIRREHAGSADINQ
jgi:hypothetical protein